MGAIYGVWGSAASDAELRAMGRALAHRGDLMHLRRYGDDLAVGAIGADPDASVLAGDGLVIVCDVTIYNGAELVSRLRGRGVAPPIGRTPAAIVHALHRSEGLEGLEPINGDYAFALIDRRRGEEGVVFGRDFLGVRPLHYAVLPSGGVAFASEYKALLQLSGVRPVVDRDMVQHLQCAKSLPVGRTLLANVVEAPPSGTVRLDRAGAVRSRTDLPPLPVEATVADEAEAIDLLLGMLRETVRRRSQDLDRIGLALSGGIDSILIAFLLRELYPDRPIYAFTAGHGPDDPEIATARRAAQAIGAIHHEVITGPDLVREHLYPLAWHLEDPIARTEALQLYWLARAARDHVDVLLHCDGADGLFAGMPRHRLLWLMAGLPPPLRGPLREFYDLTQLGLPPRSLLGKALDRAHNRGRVPPVPRVPGARMPERPTLPPVGAEFVNVCCARTYGLKRGQKFDRAFAAWGQEARSPFYDPELCRVAFAITDRLKLRGRTDKYILRRAAAKVVPEEFLAIPKFPQRMRYDLAFAEALDAIAASVLSEPAVRRRGLFSPDGIRRLFRPRADRPYASEAAMRLWTAALTECWAQQFVDRRAAFQRRRDAAEQQRADGDEPRRGLPSDSGQRAGLPSTS